jgi:hypothetical protein
MAVRQPQTSTIAAEAAAGSTEVSAAGKSDRGVSPAMLFRNLFLAIFLIYCVLPAAWIVVAMTKDNGQHGIVLATYKLSTATAGSMMVSQLQTSMIQAACLIIA